MHNEYSLHDAPRHVSEIRHYRDGPYIDVDRSKASLAKQATGFGRRSTYHVGEHQLSYFNM